MISIPREHYTDRPITSPRKSVSSRAKRLGLRPENLRVPRIILLSLNVGATASLIRETRAEEVPWVYAARPMYVGTVAGSNVGIIWAAPGAPLATMIMEDLVACGADVFLGVGSLGAIKPSIKIGDQVVPTVAVRDEGTSYHYLPSRIKAVSSRLITRAIVNACDELGVTCHRGPVLTTDAPYRETRPKIMYFQKRGVLGVDMETSALLSLGIYRRVQVACILAAASNRTSSRKKSGPFYIEGSRTAKDAVLTAVKVAVKATTRIVPF